MPIHLGCLATRGEPCSPPSRGMARPPWFQVHRDRGVEADLSGVRRVTDAVGTNEVTITDEVAACPHASAVAYGRITTGEDVPSTYDSFEENDVGVHRDCAPRDHSLRGSRESSLSTFPDPLHAHDGRDGVDDAGWHGRRLRQAGKEVGDAKSSGCIARECCVCRKRRRSSGAKDPLGRHSTCLLLSLPAVHIHRSSVTRPLPRRQHRDGTRPAMTDGASRRVWRPPRRVRSQPPATDRASWAPIYTVRVGMGRARFRGSSTATSRLSTTAATTPSTSTQAMLSASWPPAWKSPEKAPSTMMRPGP